MNSENKYPLHKAVLDSDTEEVRRLVKISEINKLDNHGNSALHWAVFKADFEIAEVLLNAGADPNVFSADGVTPKWRTRDFGLAEIESLLERFQGRIDTNENFNRNAFKGFNDFLGIPLPPNDKH